LLTDCKYYKNTVLILSFRGKTFPERYETLLKMKNVYWDKRGKFFQLNISPLESAIIKTSDKKITWIEKLTEENLTKLKK
jgi:hypothetical protein